MKFLRAAIIAIGFVLLLFILAAPVENVGTYLTRSK